MSLSYRADKKVFQKRADFMTDQHDAVAASLMIVPSTSTSGFMDKP